MSGSFGFQDAPSVWKEKDVIPAKYLEIVDENVKLKDELEFCKGLIMDLQQESSNYQRAMQDVESLLRPVLKDGYSILAHEDGSWGVGFFGTYQHIFYKIKAPSLLEALKALPKALEEEEQ